MRLAGMLPRRAIRSCGAAACASFLALVASAPVHAQPAGRAAVAATTEQQRVSTRELRNELRRADRVSVPVELTRRGDQVVLQASDASVRVANPSAISKYVRQLPVRADVMRDDAGVVQVRGVELEATESWRRRWQQLPPRDKQRYSRINAAQRRVSDAADRALAADATEADLRTLDAAVDQAQEAVVAEYSVMRVETNEAARAEQRMLVEEHRELQRASKGMYGLNRDDRYPPQAYQTIFDNSRGAFALKRLGEPKPRCSGVLIGDHLGLTNNHCIGSELPDEFVVVFDYEDTLAGSHLEEHAFPVTDFLIEDEDDRAGLDFVLLELGEVDGKSPGASYKPQCLSTELVKRDDPLYVVGYPLGDPRTVHDNAFVYFPWRVTEAEYAELELLVRSEFASLQDEQQSWIDGKLREFSDSYKRHEGDAGAWYEYISTRFGDQPTIGADSDTYRGNSGSPVFHRRTHHVIGLLFDGQDDLSTPWEPGWRAHEAVLPIAPVIARLDAVFGQWRDEPGTCVASLGPTP